MGDIPSLPQKSPSAPSSEITRSSSWFFSLYFFLEHKSTNFPKPLTERAKLQAASTGGGREGRGHLPQSSGGRRTAGGLDGPVELPISFLEADLVGQLVTGGAELADLPLGLEGVHGHLGGSPGSIVATAEEATGRAIRGVLGGLRWDRAGSLHGGRRGGEQVSGEPPGGTEARGLMMGEDISSAAPLCPPTQLLPLLRGSVI